MSIVSESSLIFGLILLNGVLSMSEMAVVSAKKNRLKKMEDDGHGGAGTALRLAESHGDFLASIQVGITLIGVLAGAFSGATISKAIANQVLANSPDLAPYADAIGLAIVVFSITYLSLVFGELVPKRLALQNPETIAVTMARPLAFLGKALRPIVFVLSRSSSFILTLLQIRSSRSDTITEEEVRFMIEEGTEAGVFDKQEETLMKRVLRFDDFNMGDLMTPRTQVVAFDVNDPIDEVLTQITSHSHSFFPIFDTHLDQPLGILSTKKVLEKLIRKEPIDLKSCLEPALFLPETLPADDALERFRQMKKHIGFVVDEHGGFAGIVTINDLLSSIVGDIPSSHPQVEQKISQRTDGSLLVDGQMPFQEVFDFLDLKARGDEDYQTIAGLILDKLAKIPSEGDKIEIGPYVFEVIDMDRHRIDKILVTRVDGTPPPASGHF